MYDNNFAPAIAARRTALVTGVVAALVAALADAGPASAQLAQYQPPAVVRRITGPSEKLELTTNSSRVLTLDKRIPRVVVNNPELLSVTPLSATQVQISAKKAGVTQVNLWDEDGNIHAVDVLIYGDARELELALQTQFPYSSIRVYRYSESLVLTGFVDDPTHVSQIKLLADDYAPKVIMNISVGGVQQVLLKVKVYEVSRTKLRQLGTDWAYLGPHGGLAINSISEILSGSGGNIRDVITNNNETFSFGIVNGGQQFYGLLEALQQRQIAKVLAEPNIVAVSGRPAQFNSGGEIPVLIPQSLGTTTIEFKKFGTQVDFLPIVLGNGNIRLEVRPRVSSLDPTIGIELQGTSVPGFRVREVDTAVELKAGQTFAIAGLVEEKSDSLSRGLPYISDIPIIGIPFRKVEETVEEIELLIMVTPEFVDAMEPHEVPCGGPGFATVAPTTHDLYCNGFLEVPPHCNPISGPQACGGECYGPAGCQCGNCQFGGGVNMPGGVGYENEGGSVMRVPGQMSVPQIRPLPNVPDDLPLPGGGEFIDGLGQPNSAALRGAAPPLANRRPAEGQLDAMPQYSAPRPYSAPRQPIYMRNAPNPNNPQAAGGQSAGVTGPSGLIGPIGYDVE